MGSHQPGTEPTFLMSPALAGEFFTAGAAWEAPQYGLPLGKFHTSSLEPCSEK